MSLLAPLRELDAAQRHTVLASFLGWTLDALLFGRLADRFGRRPILMLDVVLFSIFEFATVRLPRR